MAEETNATQEVVNSPESQNESGLSTLSPEQLAKEVEKVRKEAAKYRTKLREVEDAAKNKELEDAKKRGEYERLYLTEVETRKSMEQRLMAFEKAQENEYQDITGKWSDDDKALIPESLPIADRLSLAKRLQAKLHATPQVSLPGTAGGIGTKPNNNFNGMSEEDYARKYPKEYLKLKGISR